MSRREPNLTTKTTFDTTDEVRGISGSTSVNFSYLAMFDAFSGLSSLNQIGDPLGVPILDQPAAGTNNFRNLESSKGVIASVSAQNGIKLACNFFQAESGAKVIKNLSAAQYQFKTMVPGANMALTETEDSIIFNFSPDVATNKTVIISAIVDFPDAVAGVRALADDTDYLIVNDITTTDRFTTNGSTTIRAASSQLILLKYTGSGTMFTMSNSSVKFDGITLSAPDGKLFNHSNTSVTGVFQMVECNIEECDEIGTFNNMFITRIYATGYEDIKTTGMLFTGTHLNLDLDTAVIFLHGGTFIDLGSAVFNAIAITRQTFQLTSSGSFIKGLTASGNITSIGLGAVSDCRTLGLVTPLTGVSADDARWNFIINDEIPDTRPDGLLSMQGNTTNTVIAVAGTPVLVAGTWVVDTTSQMTGTTGGKLTYDGGKNAKLPITSSVTLSPVSGGTISVSAQIAINGVPIANSKRSASTAPGVSSSITMPWQYNFSTTDNVEVFVTNEDTTVDLLVSSAIHRVN